MHWGDRAMIGRLDYPIHDSIYALQSLVLKDLLSGDRLSRLRDIELKSQQGQALTLPELFSTLQQDIWTEVVEPDKEPMKISSLRRALQREHLELMTKMVLRLWMCQKMPALSLGTIYANFGIRSTKHYLALESWTNTPRHI
jgi:hypothetical protein